MQVIERNWYTKEGNFIPLTGRHGNTNSKLSYLRNTFMEAERNYFEYLLSIERIRNKFITLLDEHSDDLFDYAVMLQDRLEYGELETEKDKKLMQSMTPMERDDYHMKNLEYTEGLLCLLFAAARDKEKIKELIRVKYPEYSVKSR